MAQFSSTGPVRGSARRENAAIRKMCLFLLGLLCLWRFFSVTAGEKSNPVKPSEPHRSPIDIALVGVQADTRAHGTFRHLCLAALPRADVMRAQQSFDVDVRAESSVAHGEPAFFGQHRRGRGACAGALRL